MIHRNRPSMASPARRGVLLLACSVLLLASPLFAADWYQWRGPDRTGISAETGLLQSWPEGGPPLEWQINTIGQGDGGPVTKGPHLFIQGTRDGSDMLFCLNRETGEELWALRLDKQYQNGNNPGPSSTPTIDGDRIYALSGYGTLVCAGTQDGSLIWSVNFPDDFKGRAGGWGYAESPLVEGEKLIVAPGAADGTIVALNKMTGEKIWSSAGLRDVGSYASAIAADVGEIRAIIHFTAAAGVGIEASSGRLLWRYGPPANRTANAATPVFRENRVFYSSAYGNGGGLLELAPVGDRVLSRQVYFVRHMQNHFGNVVLLDDALYGASGNVLTCIDFSTGKILWQDRSIGKVSINYADGCLYMVSERGSVGLARATPDGYQQLGAFNLVSPQGPTRTAPIVSDGRMFVRNVERLLCYDVRAR